MYQYLEKRDHTGTILKFNGYSHAKRNTEKCIDIISRSNIYKFLCEKFPKKYVEAYFSKMIFYELLPISHQITISNWENKDEKNVPKKIIKTGTFFMSKHLKDVLIDSHNFVFKKNKINLIKCKKKLLNLIKPIYYKCLNLKNFFFKRNANLSLEDKNYLAVCYARGISKNKRSDFFWLYDLGKNTPKEAFEID